MESQFALNNTQTAAACIHCGNPIRDDHSPQFCCMGCETVYFWIQDHQLERFYSLKKNNKSIRKANPARESQESFQYLDHPDFLQDYSWTTSEGRWMEFYVEGVHCAACIWLTEKIQEIVDHVSFIRLNLGTSTATVRIDFAGSFSKVAEELQKMGYRAHAIKKGESSDLQKKENRRFLSYVGLAGACAGNIMLLAICLYGGADGVMARRFEWIMFALFLPVIVYSANPFYKSAWSSIKNRNLSIDIPVVFGLLLGTFVSIANLINGDPRIYFDSLSTLIFLLLSTRYLLKRAQQLSLNSSHMTRLLKSHAVRRWSPKLQSYEEIALDSIQLGDRVQVFPGESIPVDGLIHSGTSSLNCALLSGESEPKGVKPGNLVFAGTVNLEGPLEILVTQSGTKTRVGRILESTQALLSSKAPITLFADRVSRYFVAAVVILAAATFIGFFPNDWHEGLNRALAISIVTCPCTFALITPLVLSRTLGKLVEVGILVKGASVLEKLTQVKNVFLDKTGTLTYGDLRISSWDVPENLTHPIFSIETYSNHPVAKAIVSYLRPRIHQPALKVEQIHEELGTGIKGWVQSDRGMDWIEIRRGTSSNSGSEVAVFQNHMQVGKIGFVDQIRPDAQETVKLLRTLSLEPWMISGDQKPSVDRVAESTGIAQTNTFSEVSPERKIEIIKTHPFSCMVGDGANDAMALAGAYVGIATSGGVEVSLQAADIYVSRQGLKSLYDLFVVSTETIRIVRRNLYLTLGYNLTAGVLALFGKINPLTAAILMPASALVVFLSSIIGTTQYHDSMRRLRK